MAGIQFFCSHCGKSINVSKAVAQLTIPCPHCEAPTRVPAIESLGNHGVNAAAPRASEPDRAASPPAAPGKKRPDTGPDPAALTIAAVMVVLFLVIAAVFFFRRAPGPELAATPPPTATPTPAAAPPKPEAVPPAGPAPELPLEKPLPAAVHPACCRSTLAEVTNRTVAVETLIAQACGGSTTSQFAVGRAFIDGTDVRPNEEEALRWLTRAAAGGSADAQYLAGMIRRYSRGPAASDAKAAECFRPAADAGLPAAQYEYGLLLRRSADTNIQASATDYFRKAAASDHAGAAAALGLMILDGKGPRKNDAAAVRWLTLAADKGNTEAATGLGRCYLAGTGVTKDPPKALALFKAGAEAGDPMAQYWLGRCHADGLAGPTNTVLALGWLRQAQESGHPKAEDRIQELSRQLSAEAKATFHRKNDPAFSADPELKTLADTVALMRHRVSFPNLRECETLLPSCDRLLEKPQPEPVVRAIIGSRLLLEYERDMIQKGYERYGAVFMDADSIAQARKSVADRHRELAEWQKKQNVEMAARERQLRVRTVTVYRHAGLGKIQSGDRRRSIEDSFPKVRYDYTYTDGE